MAGSSAVYQGLIRGAIDGSPAPEKGYPVLFTADSVTGAFPVHTLPSGLGGKLVDFGLKFGAGALAPDSLTYTIADENGLAIKTATITASTGRGNMALAVPLFGGTITFTGNTTVSATVLATLYLV